LTKNVEFKVATSSGRTKGHVTANLEKNVGVYLNHTLSLDDSIGFRVGVDLPKTVVGNDGKSSDSPLKFDFDVAGQHRVCKSTVLAGKFSFTPQQENLANGLRLGAGLIHSFPGTNCTATLGADINVSGFIGKEGHPDHSLGFELKLK